ncbi:MAG TPA: hypothetical protein VKE42_00085 [Candidatus Cybelea sp.]|nr:hypothetical protein [Candidatus Cybelea sp.]
MRAIGVCCLLFSCFCAANNRVGHGRVALDSRRAFDDRDVAVSDAAARELIVGPIGDAFAIELGAERVLDVFLNVLVCGANLHVLPPVAREIARRLPR